MYNNPFASRQNTLSYNNIKRNRVVRSQKKISNEVYLERYGKEINPHFKTQLKALIQSAPEDQCLLVNCIDQLREKLEHLKTSPKRKHTPEQRTLFSKKTPENRDRARVKTNIAEQSRKYISKSVSLVPKKLNTPPSLLDLQQMRNQIKRRKQSFVEKRIPTQKQKFRYQEQTQGDSPPKSVNKYKKSLRYSSQNRMRSNTEEVIKSSKYQGRYCHNPSPKKIIFYQDNQSGPFKTKVTLNEKQFVVDNNFIQEEPKDSQERLQVVDNNEKIGDLSTITKQKETLNFLGESCLAIKQQLSPKKVDPNSSKILKFVDWRTKQLKNAFSGSKNKKRKAGIDKLNKIFPKGFFT